MWNKHIFKVTYAHGPDSFLLKYYNANGKKKKKKEFSEFERILQSLNSINRKKMIWSLTILRVITEYEMDVFHTK